MTAIRELRRVRDYYWGAIYLSDAEDGDFDPDAISGPGPVWADPVHITIAAVNSRAVAADDADVELLVRVLDEPLAEAQHSSVLDVPTGVLTIGDADECDDITLCPGKWRTQINVDRPDDPSKVEVCLSPASED